MSLCGDGEAEFCFQIRFIKHASFVGLRLVLRFSKEQFSVFEEPVRREWIAQAAERLHQTYSGYFKALHVEARDLEPLCAAVERWAAESGLTGQRDVSQLCCVASTLGHEFWRDPRFGSYVNGAAGNADVSKNKAVEALINNVHVWLGGLWQNDTVEDFARRLDRHIRQNDEPDTQKLMAIVPNHWVLFDADTNERLVAWLKQNLPPTSISAQRLAYVSLALVYGTGWVRDPQYVHLVRMIETATSSTMLADNISAMYAEMA
ncbi:hypothetical protein HKX32_19380 [Sulfitobacter sp. KE42]|nr:hypothetical protein [Sulfitobacter sp. KE42]